VRVVKTGLIAILLGCACLTSVPTLRAAAMSMQEAIAKVERETHGKVLSAETKRTGNRAVYRIKVLTRDGRVQVIEVPADA
jgi:uncharacterized membrane protein YkoI